MKRKKGTAKKAYDLKERQNLLQLQKEIKELRSLIPPDGFIGTPETTKAHINYINKLVLRTRDSFAALGMDTGKSVVLDRERVPITDFEWPSYDEFEPGYRELVSQYRNDGIFISATTPISYNMLMSARGALPIPWWLTKLLKLFGIDEEDIQDFAESFLEEIGDDLYNRIFNASQRRQWKQMADAIEEALEKILENGEEFLERLGRKLARRYGRSRAARKAAKLIGKMMSKFVPFFGWAAFIVEFLYYLCDNLIDAMT